MRERENEGMEGLTEIAACSGDRNSNCDGRDDLEDQRRW